MAVPNHDIREVIGQGGMATVYRAEHVLLKQERALKLMSAELSREPGFQESFLREGQTVAGLQHPNIVTIHDIGQCGDGYFMSMEYLRGGSLQARLKAGPLPLQEALTVLRQVGGALAHAHERGLIHRDIKPANILFRANGEAVLTDFGISKLQDTDSDLTRHGYAMLGTPRYMSPEQTGAQRLDRRSDIYSLALVFYEMLAGKTAIRADTVAQIIREHALAPPPVLPEHYACLQAVLDKALAKQPEERYSNVAAFLQAVEQSLAAGAEDQTVILPPPQATEPPAKRGRRPALYLLPLLLLPTGAGWWYWAGGKAEQAPSAVTPPVVPAASIPAKEVEAHTPPPPVPPEPAAPQELAAVPVQPIVEQKTEPLELAAVPVQPTVEPVAQPAGPATTMRVRVSPYAVLYREPDGNERIGEIAQGAEVTVLGSASGSGAVAWKKVNSAGREGFVKAGQLEP